VAGFPFAKSDLAICLMWPPINQVRILVCFLARLVWKTLSGIELVDVVVPTRFGRVIRKRSTSRPTEHKQLLIQRFDQRLPAAPVSAAM
jgi:hypothetical protein